MADKKQTQILLINEMAGYGKVALSVMIPVLSHLRFETFNLPTLQEQMEKLLHTSNLFYNVPAIEAAKLFNQASGME